MRRRVNVRLLLFLLAGSALLAIGLYWLYGIQVRRGAGVLLARADRAEQEGDLAKAADALRQYLQLRPDSPDVLARYGLLLDCHARSPAARAEAFLVLQQAFRHPSQRSAFGRRLVQLAMGLARYGEARAGLETLLADTPGDGELEEWYGQCEEAFQRNSQAREFYAKALRHAPQRMYSYERLAALQRLVGQTEEADQTMERMVAANPQSFAAYVARGRYRQSAHSLDEAAKDIATALALAPDNAEVLLAAAELARAQNRPDQARGFLERGIKIAAENPRLYTTLALVEQQAGRDEQAVQCLRRGLQAVPETEQEAILLVLVDLLISRNELKEAANLLERLRLGPIDPLLLDYQSARLLLQKGQWSSALRILGRIQPLLINAPELAVQVNLRRAECYEKLGASDLQMNALRQAVTVDPLSTQARLQFGSALLAQDRIDEAIREFELMTAPPTSSRILLAQAVLMQNARLPADKRDLGKLGQVVEQATQVAPSALTVLLLQAEVCALQGQPERGRQILEKARTQHPDQVDFWVALARWDERFGASKAVVALLDEAEQHVGNRAELQLVRLDHLLRQQTTQAGPFLSRLEEQLEQYPAAAQEELLNALADGHARLGKNKEAERLWSQLAKRQPTNVLIRSRLLGLSLQTGDDVAVRLQVQAIKDLEGEDGTLWRYGEAARLIMRVSSGQSPELGQARVLLREIRARRPDWAQTACLEAEICERQGNPEAALQNYQRALELGDHRPAMVKRLLALLYERHRFDDAAQVMQQAGMRTQIPSELGPLAVAISLQTQDVPRALAVAQLAAKSEPNDYLNQFWLGLSLWAAGQKSQSETALRRAIDLNPGRPEAWVALVDLLVDNQEQPRALKVAGEAQSKLSGSVPAALALAHCFLKVGHKERAGEYYQAALAKSDKPSVLQQVASFYLQTGAAQKAEPLLRTLLSSGGTAGETAWARRNLALLVGSRESYQQFREGLSYLDRSDGSGETDVEDLRVKARLLALRAPHQREAIRIYETIALRRPLTEEEKFLLVQLYQAHQDWQGARRWATELVAFNSQNLDYLSCATRNALFEGDMTTARERVAQLQKLHPGTYQALEMRARLLQREEQGAEAVEALEKFAKTQPPERLALVAGLLEELGHLASAEKLFREYAARAESPYRTLTWAGFLARHQRLAEALDLFERAGPTLPAVSVAAASVGALAHAGTCDPDQCQRVSAWLKKALERDPQSSMLLALLADLEVLQGHLVPADSLYRQSLALDNRNVWALGNLAWLLAHEGGKANEALELVHQGEEIAGPLPPLRDARALAYLQLGQANLAIEELQRALEVDRTASLYFHLAQAFDLITDQSAAKNALQQASTAPRSRGTIHPLETEAYRSLFRKTGSKEANVAKLLTPQVYRM